MKTYQITIRGTVYEVTVGDLSASPVSVTVNGETYEVDLPAAGAPAATGSPRQPASRASTPASPPRPAAQPVADDGSIRALMPGRIISVNVSVGDHVTAGQPVLVMESMKMENTISAVKDGTVTAVHVAEGDSVQHGQTMVEVKVD